MNVFPFYRMTSPSQLRYDDIFVVTIHFVGTHSITITSLTCINYGTQLLYTLMTKGIYLPRKIAAKLDRRSDIFFHQSANC